MLRSVFIQGETLLEESEDEETAETSESVSGFFVKHGTFMGNENEHAISQTSDMAASDSDYDTDLETEGKIEIFSTLNKSSFSAPLLEYFGSVKAS